jgi:luciferase family oxidoreductase group 1
VLIARVAAETRHLRVGSGGVMLPHYSALKVAEQFRMLEALYPGRIDLGIGRAPGSDGRTALALQPGPHAYGVEHFPRQVADLIGWLAGALPDGHPFAAVKAQPTGPTLPEIWVLGSSGDSAQLAAHFGLSFAHAHFIAARGGAEACAFYRENFRPSALASRPRVALAAFALTADTDQEARRIASSRDLWRLRLDQGILGPVPTVAEAEAYAYSDIERARVERNRQRQIVGAPEAVRSRLVALAEEHGADELIVVSICHDPAARRRSYALLAEAFALPARAAA